MTQLWVVEDSDSDFTAFQRAVTVHDPSLELVRWRRAGDVLLALEGLPPGQPCAVFVDLVLPGLEGQWLVQHMRRIPSLSSLPIIVMTGSRERFREHISLQAGANECLHKCLDIGEWALRLSDCLKRRLAPA